MKYIILFLFLTTVKNSDDINITSYLEQFGYLESNGSLLTETSLTSASHTNEALIRFQEFYNLPTDGTLNQETLAFISKPRCGVKDNPTAYRVHYQKLCDFNKEIDTFLIANHHMYIFYKKYVWLVNLKDMTYDKEPKLIKDYLYFLPDDFKEISHIYQRPSGDVLIVVKNLYYLIDFLSFNVKSGYNSQSIENLGIPKRKRIDAIFRTYSRKTYIFYDNVLYIEFDECLFRSKKNGLISELFAGIPPNISRAFRYRNLYFFKDKMFYEFDDISNTLVKSDKFDLTVFGFKCGLIDQIIKLINRL
jgi:hypothetical protein